MDYDIFMKELRGYKFSNFLGIEGKISLKEKLTFDVVWQRKLPEIFYPLRFHTKKIRIFD
jgi:hypothetical protein